jgi:GTP-binding protein
MTKDGKVLGISRGTNTRLDFPAAGYVVKAVKDITVNVCKTKHLTNTRASGSDDALRLVPVSKFSLEGCLEFLAPDELLEVTPENLRIRKRILDHDLRMKAASKKNK